MRQAVREHADRGVDVIKIIASGGRLTPGSRPELSQFGLAELHAAVDEAHRHSLPITAHAHGTQAVADAVTPGADGLEHASFWTDEGVDEAPEQLVKAMATRRIVAGLTLGVAPASGAMPPPEIIARILGMQANARRLWRAGVPLVAGTDAGLAPGKPHDVVRWAVQQLTEIGPTPVEALRATTSGAAAVCGLAHRKGRIAPGYDADILAVDGNLLTDPTALHRIRAVWLRGRPVPDVQSGSINGDMRAAT